MPLCGYAAGLGKLNINSGLGEPLKAEVELLSVTPEELSSLTAAIASEEAYSMQGITRLGIHNNIKIDLTKSADGSPVLRLRSSQPINDPYLDMLIQVDWSSGRLLREYTVLLDPPQYKPAIDDASALTVNKSSVNSNRASALSSKQQSASGKKSKNANIDSDAVQSGTDELTTKRGDTLSSIAKEMQVDGISIDQMLVGLFESNKEAFTNGNMNRLKVGQIIKAPSKERLTAIDVRQAKQAVKVHSANWNSYRNSLAGSVAAAPSVEEVEQKQSSSGKIATAEDRAKSVTTGSQDVVKLSAGDKAATKEGREASVNAEAKILALQEDATAQEKALKETLDRTAALEKQIEDMQKLLALRSQTMKNLQENAESVAKPIESSAVASAEVTPVPDVSSEPSPEVKPTSEPTLAPEVKKEAAIVDAPVVAEPELEQSFIGSLFGNTDSAILGGAAGLTLLGAGWFFLRNKRRKELDSFERGILTSGGLRANTVFGNTTGNANTSDTSFLTDFAQSADGNMIDTNDVDPIAEAEVYMAYGRDAQAEEILKDAITKEPKRYELHLKLLEMYAGRKDSSAFETIAGELYTTLGAEDPTWAKVAELGAKVEPSNPLYDISNISLTNVVAQSALDASDFDNVQVSTAQELDFALDDDLAGDIQPRAEDASSAVMQSFASAQEVDQEKSFDMGSADGLLNEKDSRSEEVLNDVLLDQDLTEAKAETSNLLEFATVAKDLSDDVSSLEVPSIKDESVMIEPIVTDSTNVNVMDFGLTFDLPKVMVETTSNAATGEDAEESANFFNLSEFEDAKEVSLIGEQAVQAEEFSFDFPLSEEQDLPSFAGNMASHQDLDAKEFDFSTINLDLDDADSNELIESTSDLISVDTASAARAESQDVDIKLDLVAAYIDMDDKEGARELLDEVVKEGGPQQKQRAEQLLASIV